MPQTKVIFYKELDGSVPLLEWLDELPTKVQLKCVAKIERLKQEGHELRRPEADLLRDKIYELRASFQEFTIASFISSTAVLPPWCRTALPKKIAFHP